MLSTPWFSIWSLKANPPSINPIYRTILTLQYNANLILPHSSWVFNLLSLLLSDKEVFFFNTITKGSRSSWYLATFTSTLYLPNLDTALLLPPSSFLDGEEEPLIVGNISLSLNYLILFGNKASFNWYLREPH